MFVAKLNDMRFIEQMWPCTPLEFKETYAQDSDKALITEDMFKSPQMRYDFNKNPTKFRVDHDGRLFQKVR